MKNLTAISAVLLLIIVGLSCKDKDTQKANDFVDEANKFITTANENVMKAESKFKEFEDKIKAIDSDDKLKAAREFGKELFPLYDAMNDNFKKASEKFDEASKFKLNDKYKDYLDTKAKEMKLRADYSLEMKKIPQSMIDSKNKSEYEENRDKIKESADKMLKEAKELAEKAEKIQKDNPEVFKQN